MFTGIITGVGRIAAIDDLGSSQQHGKRLTISPLAILIALSFWSWVWGTTGALLAVPLLIIMKTVFSAAGTPDIAGFLFEEGTLTHVGDPEDKDDRSEDKESARPEPVIDTPQAVT